MKVRKIKTEDYDFILENDRQVYPTHSPVTKEVVSSWFMRNPEFGMIYEDKNKVAGLCIAIPLTAKRWYDLVDGKFIESDSNNETIFDNSRDSKMGLHVYHIERFRSGQGFYKRVLQDLAMAVHNLRKKNTKLKIIGLSGLCVTTSGCSLFANTRLR